MLIINKIMLLILKQLKIYLCLHQYNPQTVLQTTNNFSFKNNNKYHPLKDKSNKQISI